MDQVFLFLFPDLINLNFNYTCTVAKYCWVFVCVTQHPSPSPHLHDCELLLYSTAVSRAGIWDVLDIVLFHFSVNHYMAVGFYWCSWFSGPRSEYLPESYFLPGTFSDKKTAVV